MAKATTKTKTFSNSTAALKNARQLAATGQISKSTYQKLEQKLTKKK